MTTALQHLTVLDLTQGLAGPFCSMSQLGGLYAIKTLQIAAQYNPDTWEGYHCWGLYNPPKTGWQTQDRPIVFSFGEFTGGGPGKQSQWPAFCRALGLGHLLDDPRFEPDGRNSTGLGADVAPLRTVYEEAFRHRSASELVALIRRLEDAAYPYHTYATLLADAQAQALHLLQDVPGPERPLQDYQKSLELLGAASSVALWRSTLRQCHRHAPGGAELRGGTTPAPVYLGVCSGAIGQCPDSAASVLCGALGYLYREFSRRCRRTAGAGLCYPGRPQSTPDILLSRVVACMPMMRCACIRTCVSTA